MVVLPQQHLLADLCFQNFILLQDEYVTGRDGQQTMLAKGCQVWITSYCLHRWVERGRGEGGGRFTCVVLHRSKALWGEDCDVFNPDREFTADELFGSFRGTVSRLNIGMFVDGDFSNSRL
jgi:hypothetical protein